MGRRLSNLLVALGWAVLLYIVGFFIYVVLLPRTVYEAPRQVDALVILTGAAGRLGHGLTLMSTTQVPTLISGVHPQVSLTDLTRGAPLDGNTLTLLTIDHAAETTRQNVAVTRRWSQSIGVQQLGVVTSHYHMPRARLLFAMYAPELDVVPLPVETSAPRSFLWREYTKLVVAPFLR
jgi:uncharacterized SAM-binding protein YcdF (DUF218 family)